LFAASQIAAAPREQPGLPARRAEEYIRSVTIRSTRDPATIESLKRLALSERLDLDLIRDLAFDHPLGWTTRLRS
jgi:hypothetical protein